MLWENLLSCDFLEAVKECKGVCAIPIGCVEAHGNHLPLACDTLKAIEFTKRAAEIEPVMVFPGLYFGEKSGAGEYPGTIIFPTTLICQILEQCCHEIYRNGFKKIVLVTSHGGNKTFVNAFCRYMITQKNDFLVYHYYQEMQGPPAILEEREKYPYLTEQEWGYLEKAAELGIKNANHGDFVETANLYDVCPELVSLKNFNSLDGKSIGRMSIFDKMKIHTPFTWMADHPNSLGYGKTVPTEYVTPGIAKAMGQRTVELTANVFKFLREETISTEYHKEWLAKQVPHKVEY
jgi:creatinine amidohydrolase